MTPLKTAAAARSGEKIDAQVDGLWIQRDSLHYGADRLSLPDTNLLLENIITC